MIMKLLRLIILKFYAKFEVNKRVCFLSISMYTIPKRKNHPGQMFVKRVQSFVLYLSVNYLK